MEQQSIEQQISMDDENKLLKDEMNENEPMDTKNIRVSIIFMCTDRFESIRIKLEFRLIV